MTESCGTASAKYEVHAVHEAANVKPARNSIGMANQGLIIVEYAINIEP